MSRSFLAALAAPLVLALTIPAAASAFGGEVLVVSTDTTGSPAQVPLVLDAPTLDTHLTLEQRAPGVIRIAADHLIGIQPAGQFGPADDRCTAVDPQTVDCTTTAVTSVGVHLRGTDDQLTVLGAGLDRPLFAVATGKATMTGGSEEDSFSAVDATGPVTFDGGGGDDTLTGSWANDTLRGGPGGDDVDGYRGRDLLEGGEGDDFMTSEAVLEQSSGPDSPDPDDPASSCGGGTDFLFGGHGPDGEDLAGGLADCERRDAAITSSSSPTSIGRTGSPITITATSAGTPLDLVDVQWSRCRSLSSSACQTINATGTQYTPVADDAGWYVIAQVDAVWLTLAGKTRIGRSFEHSVRIVAAPVTPTPKPTPLPTPKPAATPKPTVPTAETVARATTLAATVKKSLGKLTSRRLLNGVTVIVPNDKVGTTKLALVLRRPGKKPLTVAAATVESQHEFTTVKTVKRVLEPRKGARKALKAAAKQRKAKLVLQTTFAPKGAAAATQIVAIAWRR